jgi:predicted neutral ceramidase superfamily lipid hydrolase
MKPVTFFKGEEAWLWLFTFYIAFMRIIPSSLTQRTYAVIEDTSGITRLIPAVLMLAIPTFMVIRGLLKSPFEESSFRRISIICLILIILGSGALTLITPNADTLFSESFRGATLPKFLLAILAYISASKFWHTRVNES